MIENKQVDLKELEKFGSVENLNEQSITIVEHQKKNWQLAKKNFDALNSIQTKTFDFGHFHIQTQFNSERIKSSAAKTDAKSIAKRPCFLCLDNLPEEQSGLVFLNKYLILANPYPIFPVHLTISHKDHFKQEIKKYFGDMLELGKALSDFTVFYNGPKTGASAPDHFHFQAIIKNSLPIENEFENLEKHHSETLFQKDKTRILAVENYFRNFVNIVSDNKNEIEKIFHIICRALSDEPNNEPMLNILCTFEINLWRVIVFPRSKQRPSIFFSNDDRQILTSPASVEMGGILVLPREEDFKKITKKEIEEIYKEVSFDKRNFKKLVLTLKNVLK